jgi:hypothetical protein
MHVQSIKRIPPHMINPARRLWYVRRAERGEDVRAYSEWRYPFDVGYWYVWDGAAIDPHTGLPGYKELIGAEALGAL